MVFPGVTVELLLGGVWTNVSSDVLARDAIQITRGRKDEGSQVEASRCSLTFKNKSGNYSPRNPAGAHFGKLGRNTSVRVSVEGSFRFHGEVSEWPASWDKKGADVTAQVEAAGVTRRLEQGRDAFSTVRRNISEHADLRAYWPAEDPSGAASLGSAVAGAPALSSYGTAPVLAAYEGFTTSLPLPTLVGASLRGSVPYYVPGSASSDSHMVVALLAIPAGNAPAAPGHQVLRVEFDGGTITFATLDWVVVSGVNSVRVTLTHRDGSTASGTAIALAVANRTIIVSLEFSKAAGVAPDTDLTVAKPEGGISSQTSTAFGTSDFYGRVAAVHVAPPGNVLDAAGHVAVYSPAPDLDESSKLHALIDNQIGENAADRIKRVVDKELPFSVGGIAADTVLMGAQPFETLPGIMRDAADTDGGILYEPRGTLGLSLRTRVDMYAREPALTLDYAAGRLAVIDPTDDDQQTKNDVTVKREGGSSARAVDTVGPLGVDTVGRYTTEVTLNPESDGRLAEIASWLLHLGTVDEARYPRLGVNLAAPAFRADAVLTAAVVALDLGDKIRVTNPPAWLPPDAIEQLVQGLTETIRPGEWTIEATCTPSRPWDIGVWDDSTGAGESRYDTLGSELAAAATSTATSLSVATTAGPLWSGADQPFDIKIGGERMTVTAVTGATSPQTFTVTRSVNGVVKAHAIGAAVSLYKPAWYAL